MKITESEAILYTSIVDDLNTLYDKIADAKVEGISPGMMLSAMSVGVIAKREGDRALHKMVSALQQLVKENKLGGGEG